MTVLAGLWFLAAKIIDATVQTMADLGKRIRIRTAPPADADIRRLMRTRATWAQKNGYEDDLMFDFHIAGSDQALFCRIWKNAAEHTYLVFYAGMDRHFSELFTIYDDNTSVTTTSAAEAHTLPVVPGFFVQAFPGSNLSRLHKLHLEGRHTLERRTGLEPREYAGSTADLIVMTLTRQAAYVRSIPGWRWKSIWWLATRKRRMARKNVGWQLDQFGVYEPEVPPTNVVQ